MTNWNKDKIVELLKSNDKAIGRALSRLYKNQTTDEQIHKDVKHRNNKGFRPCHAVKGSGMAEFFDRNGYITPKQASYWRVTDKNGKMRIEIYASQLLKEIKAG